MIVSPLLLLSLPRTIALIEVVLAVTALGLLVYLTLSPQASDRRRTVIRVAGLLVLVTLLLGGLQYLL